MEVHAHAHTSDPDSHRGRKKFAHYLWEFLMLFLAVFCGFLAENFREHQVEKERGRQYIRSLYEDLEYDTLRITKIINIEAGKIASLSKMSDCYDSIHKNWKGTNCLLDLILNSRSNNNFQSTDRTLKQLANAGGFRLLPKQDADSIVGYENDCNNNHDFETTLFQPAQDNVRNTFNELVGFSANIKLFKNVSEDPNLYKNKSELPLLFADNKTLLNKYFNQLLLYIRVTVRHRIQLMDLKQHAISLLNYFKNKYHLK